MSEELVDTAAFGQLPMVKDAIGAKDAAGEGDVQSVLSSVNGFVSDAAKIATDPVGALVGSGVEFVINFVQPVQDAIEYVAGDEAALTKSAEEFTEVQEQLDDFAKVLTEKLDEGIADWDGEAADATRRKMAEFVEGVQNTGAQANNLSQILQLSATFVEAAEGIIKGLLQDFLTWAIMTWVPALASAGPTFGASTAAAGTATTVQAGVTISRTAQRVQQAVTIIQQISSALEKLKKIVDGIRIVDSLATIATGTGHADSGKDLEGPKQANNIVGTIKNTAQTVNTLTSGVDSLVNGSAHAPDASEDGDDSSGGDAELSLDNTQKAADKELGDAADNLQEQAQEGGFSDVPSDQTLSGQLSV